MFKKAKDFLVRAKLAASARLSLTVAGCTTGIFFAASSIFKIPLDRLSNGRIPVITTMLASLSVFLFKTNKNLQIKPIDEDHSIHATVTYLKSQHSYTLVLEQLQLDSNLLTEPFFSDDLEETKSILIEIYNRIPTPKHNFEKYAVSSFWAAVQFISPFSFEMLSLAFQHNSLYGFESEEGFSTKNLCFCLVLLTAIYNSAHTYVEEMERYRPSFADIHFALVKAFTPKPVQDYGTFYEPNDISALP